MLTLKADHSFNDGQKNHGSRPGFWPIAALIGLALLKSHVHATEKSEEVHGVSPTPDITIAIRRGLPRTEIDPDLKRGYDHLQAGRLEAARRDYEAAWHRDPKNTDILLGLGSIAQRQGRPADAQHFYRQALEADPKDASALAATAGTITAADPVAQESRLKNLLATQPESGPLSFSLGNAYSRQQRWGEAQQAYFNAVAADSQNPDYLFNLAVSLDHLRQPQLAARHYRLALEAAGRQPAAFDQEGAKKRLQDIGR